MGQKLRRAPIVYETEEAKEALQKAREERQDAQKKLELLGGIAEAEGHLEALTIEIEEKKKTIEVLKHDANNVLHAARTEAREIVGKAEAVARDIKVSADAVQEETLGKAAGLKDREDALSAREKHLEDEWDKAKTAKAENEAEASAISSDRVSLKRSKDEFDHEHSLFVEKKREAEGILSSIEEVRDQIKKEKEDVEKSRAQVKAEHERAREGVRRAQEEKRQAQETLRQAKEKERLNGEKAQKMKEEKDKLQTERIELQRDREAFLIARNRVFGKETEERVQKVMSGGT